MITREQVADLRPGDVVEVFRNEWPDGTTVRGPLYEAYGWLYVAEAAIRNDQGRPVLPASFTLAVISRTPRRLYVNHDRTEPVPGDVVRDANSDHALALFIFAPEEEGEPWWLDTAADWISPAEMRDKRLRLLVDGETGQVVP